MVMRQVPQQLFIVAVVVVVGGHNKGNISAHHQGYATRRTFRSRTTIVVASSWYWYKAAVFRAVQ
jgi:hypothetical protein